MRRREDVEDERDVDHPGPGRDVGEVRDPQLVRTRGPELPVHQIHRPRRPVRRVRLEPTLPQRPDPALLPVEPLDRAPGDVVALATQVQPHLPGAEATDELLPLALGLDHRHQLGVTDLTASTVAATCTS